MNYKISYNDAIDIIYVIYFGEVSLSDRVQAVNEVSALYAAQKPLKILVNVCDLIMNLSLQEQQYFSDFLVSHPALSHAKVAVVHKPEYNPNLFIDTCAFNNGYRLSEFNQIKDAEQWLVDP